MAITATPPRMLVKKRFLTTAVDGPEAVIKRLFSGIDRVLHSGNLAAAELHAISIACAGAIDTRNGVITLSPNLPGWHDVPLMDIVKEKYGVNTFLLNDASAAALAEHQFGAGKGVRHLVYVTVSTGIGGGIIIDNKLYEGVSGSAGEIGHMTLDLNGIKDNCGNIGCLETVASGTAMAREAIKRLEAGEQSALTQLVGEKLENITAEIIAQAAEKEDRVAKDIIQQAATYLGVGLVNLVNIFNPEMIVVGGGVSKTGERLLAPARQVVRERAFPLSAQAVKIVPAKLGEDAEVLGAAAYAQRQGG
ncbi:MAG: ROK family protein [Chloroflexi bacterium]|nr:ROK family protein [Chloroflexota bacterium]